MAFVPEISPASQLRAGRDCQEVLTVLSGDYRLLIRPDSQRSAQLLRDDDLFDSFPTGSRVEQRRA